MSKRKPDVPAPFLRVIGTTGVHELADDPHRTRCGLVLADHDLEGWAELPARLKRCPTCAGRGR